MTDATLEKDNDDTGTNTTRTERSVQAGDTAKTLTDRAAQIAAERSTAAGSTRYDEDTGATEALRALVAQVQGTHSQASTLVQFGMQQLLAHQADLHHLHVAAERSRMRHEEEMAAVRQRSLNLGNTFDSARDEQVLTNAKMANAARSTQDATTADRIVNLNEDTEAAKTVAINTQALFVRMMQDFLAAQTK